MADFPLGLVLFMAQCQQDMFDCECKMFQKMCKSRLMIDPCFGFIPPIYKDIWHRFEYLAHNSCYTLIRTHVN